MDIRPATDTDIPGLLALLRQEKSVAADILQKQYNTPPQHKLNRHRRKGRKDSLPMNRSKSFNYRVNFSDEAIEISKAFATAAQKANSPAHKQLMEIRKAYPGFGIIIYKTTINQSKQKYIHWA